VTSSTAGRSGDHRAIAVVLVVLILVGTAVVVGLRVFGRGGGSVLLLGDSITYGLEPTARDRLGDRYALAVDGIPGVVASQQVEAANSASRFAFDQAVINLGTNDVSDPDQDLNETAAALEQIVTTLDAIDCVHLVTINESMLTNGSSGPRAQQLNQIIRDLAERHENTDVVDWAAIVRDSEDERESITTDTVHPNERGNELLADAYGEALDACST
jgi:lysophospholipase L1-like esterase